MLSERLNFLASLHSLPLNSRVQRWSYHGAFMIIIILNFKGYFFFGEMESRKIAGNDGVIRIISGFHQKMAYFFFQSWMDHFRCQMNRREVHPEAQFSLHGDQTYLKINDLWGIHNNENCGVDDNEPIEIARHIKGDRIDDNDEGHNQELLDSMI